MAEMRRGSNVELTREIPDLAKVILGVRFNAGSEHVLADNLVVATLLTDRSSRILSDEHFVFFNQLSSPEESVSQREAALGGDDEQVEVDLAAVPAAVERVVVVLYLNEGIAQRRSLGQLRECVIRVVDAGNNSELVRSENLAPALSAETAIALGELYRHSGGWKFKVIGDGYTKGIAGIAADYGIAL
ncbi:TerD family protein [Jatrophihabitans telluris]|uniref:TerD family protein n=1 Tax=Jatrophihabitans telluris TaxID=2038343 RepID=A0ABY4R384_9ACTN|nr:TerD family protein [Jatrophihabitans telluris]UQX90259.1 TerD family protein [Jatrophihabitans telluris]